MRHRQALTKLQRMVSEFPCPVCKRSRADDARDHDRPSIVRLDELTADERADMAHLIHLAAITCSGCGRRTYLHWREFGKLPAELRRRVVDAFLRAQRARDQHEHQQRVD